MIKKIILIALVLAVGITLATCGLSYMERKAKESPGIEEARYQIRADGITYYSPIVDEDDKTVTMRTFWSQNDGQWVRYDVTLLLKRNAYKSLVVSKRE